MNDAYRLAPGADVLYTSDLAWLTHYDGVPGFRGLKVTIEQQPGQGARKHASWPDWLVLRHTGDAGLETDPGGLRTIKNSGGAAINLAAHLGARRIVLLGYDMGTHNGKKHWFGDHPRPINANSPYATFLELFATMVGPLAARGIEVINSTRTTALTCFPQRSLEDALCG